MKKGPSASKSPATSRTIANAPIALARNRTRAPPSISSLKLSKGMRWPCCTPGGCCDCGCCGLAACGAPLASPVPSMAKASRD